MSQPRPTVRRRRLASLLVELREGAGKSMDEAAERIGCHKTKISRIENARLGISLGELRDLLTFYGIDDAAYVEELVGLARRGGERGWSRNLGATLPSYADHIDYEQAADHIRSFQPLLVAGLLQTPDYTRALYRANPENFSAEQLDCYVDTRMQRQEILEKDDAPRLAIIEGEAALRNEVGGTKVLRPQLDHLLEATDHPNIEIQVLPFNSGAHVGLTGSFVMFGFPTTAFSDVVCVEHITGTFHMESADEIRSYTLAFDSLRSLALSPTASRDLIRRVRNEL